MSGNRVWERRVLDRLPLFGDRAATSAPVDGKHHTFSRICEALCGIEVTVEDGRIAAIEPDADHVATGGFGCVKGMKQHRLYDSPDRITAPMKRVGDRHVPATWEEALADIGSRVRGILATSSPDAIAMYVGTAAGFSVLHPIFAQGFMDGIGSRSLYASATQDCSNKFAVSDEMYGFPFRLTYPDVDRTECLVVVGANPAVSKWSFLQVSNPVMRLREIQERGGRVIVVDPRRTETAQRAEHVPIRPDTDVFFYLGFLHEVLQRGAVDHDLVDRHTTGFSRVVQAVAEWTPERCGEITGIPADDLRDVVSAYLAADGAALYCSTGVNMGRNGALAFWLQEVINAVTGNLDRPGGVLVGDGQIDLPKLLKKGGRMGEEAPSRVGGFPKVNGAFPGGILADEILTPGDGRVRALFVTGGNPLITMANAGRLRDAFEQLDLLVTLDIFVNETGTIADWVLPATAPFQRPDLPFLFPFFLGLQSRPYLQATRPVVEPEGLQRDEASIYVDLCRACGVDVFGSAAVQKPLQWAMDRDANRHPGRPGAIPQERILDLLLRVSRNGSFADLAAEPHGRALPDQPGRDFLGERVLTEDGRVRLAPPRFLEGLEARLAEEEARQRATDGRFRLITLRHVRTHNSWTHNAEEFTGPRFSTNHVHLHPDDAAALGLDDDDLADVATEVATVRVPVRLNDDLMRGVCAVPHGWGHQHASGLSVASRTTGVNVNLLAADGPDGIDRLSGMANLTGFVVDVTPAAGPLDPTSWSGLSTPDAGRVPADA